MYTHIYIPSPISSPFSTDLPSKSNHYSSSHTDPNSNASASPPQKSCIIRGTKLTGIAPPVTGAECCWNIAGASNPV